MGLPGIFIIGVVKGGSTSLHQYLIQHPRIRPGANKEVNYFNQYYHRGRAWYEEQYPPLAPGDIGIDSSVDYLSCPHAAGRLHELCPQAKLIVLLRDPVERAYSQYLMHCRNVGWTISFEQALLREQLVWPAEAEKIAHDPAGYVAEHQRLRLLTRGYYARHLNRWLALYPRESFLVMKSEDFFADPEAGLLRAIDFIGLEWQALPEYMQYNARTAAADMDPATREFLERHFAPHNAALAELLGDDFTWRYETAAPATVPRYAV